MKILEELVIMESKNNWIFAKWWNADAAIDPAQITAVRSSIGNTQYLSTVWCRKMPPWLFEHMVSIAQSSAFLCLVMDSFLSESEVIR